MSSSSSPLTPSVGSPASPTSSPSAAAAAAASSTSARGQPLSMTVMPKPGESPADWARIWDADRKAGDGGLLEVVLEANGISKKQFLDGATLGMTSLDLFLLRVPQGLPVLSLFPRLTTLRLMNIGLRSVNYLQPLAASLQVLWLSENDIGGEIGPGQLDMLHQLRELYLHFNNIERIAPAALQGLDRLEVLWLNENRLAGELAGVAHLKSLRVLNLGNNKISSIASSSSTSPQSSTDSNSNSNGGKQHGALPSSLVELNVAGNRLDSFADLQPLLQLPRLAKLTLSDPTYGAPNPVCRLNNLQTFLIFHARALATLDGAPVTQQQRLAARTTYLQKYAFYSMRARSLRNHMRAVQAEVDSVAAQRIAHILSGAVALQKLIYQLREADCCNSSNSSGGGGSSDPSTPMKALPSSPSSASPLESSGNGRQQKQFCDGILTALSSGGAVAGMLAPLIEQLVAKLRDALSVCDAIRALAQQVGDDALRPAVDEIVRRSRIELHTGGNVRYEEQFAVPSTSQICAAALPSAPIVETESFAWFRSCVDLFRSRMFLPDFSAKGVLDMVVTRVTKVHNKALRARFDAALEELVDVSDPSFKRGIEYLFLVLPSDEGGSAGDGDGDVSAAGSHFGLDTGVGPGAAATASLRSKQQQQQQYKAAAAKTLAQFVEEGAAASDEPVVLTNSIYLHEARTLQRSGFAPQQLRGRRVVLCKVFLGRSFPEAPELSSGMSDADLSAKPPKIDGRKVLPAEMHAVMRFKKGAGESASAAAASAASNNSSSSSNAATRQRVWFVYRSDLVLPEYVVHFDYKVPTSSSAPVGDISAFPWINSARDPDGPAAAAASGGNNNVDSSGGLAGRLKEEYLTALRACNLVDPTRRGDLDAVLNRVSAAIFSAAAGGAANGNNDLLLMMPPLIQFASKTAEMVDAALKSCASVHAAVGEKVESLRKTNPALLATIGGGGGSKSSDAASTTKVPDQIEPLVQAHAGNRAAFVHLFSEWSSAAASVGGSTSPTKSAAPAMQLLRSLAAPQWGSSLQVLVLPFAALGPELPAADMLAGVELPALVELDLSFNALKLFHFDPSKQPQQQQDKDGSSASSTVVTPFAAPNLLRLNLAENELHHARDLAAIAASHPKLRHLMLFGNAQLPAAAVDDYLVATAFTLETLDGNAAVHERATELRSLPSSLTTTRPFVGLHPEWFDLSIRAADSSSARPDDEPESAEAACFTFELLPRKFTRRNRIAAFVEDRIQGALKRATTTSVSDGAAAAAALPSTAPLRVLTLNVSALRIERGAIAEFSTSSSLPAGFDFSQLRRLDLSSNNIKSAPFKFLMHQQQPASGVCPQLEYLSLANNRIASIRCLDMFAPRLRCVDLQGNEIASLIGLPGGIHVVYAEGNRLSTLADVLRFGPNMNKQQQQQQPAPGTAAAAASSSSSPLQQDDIPLSRATELYLADNLFHACRDVVLPLKERNTRGDLFILDLSRNRFRDGELDAMHFALCHLPKLKVYNGVPVDAAQLQTAREVYAGKLSEEVLIAKAGPPSTWRSGGSSASSSSSSSSELDLSNMALREIDLLAHFVGLQHLMLEGNLLSDLSPLSHCVSLQSLDVSFNRGLGAAAAAAAIASNMNSRNGPASVGLCLAGARNTLSSLALEGCNIASVASLQLGHLPNLRFLNLKGNEIQEMADGGFDGLALLQELVLDQNKIKAVDGLGRCGQLARLSMDENLLKSLDGVRYLRALTHLSVAMNRIADLNEFESVALAGTIQPGGATNAENAATARSLLPDPSSSNNNTLLFAQQQQHQLCKVETLNVQSNPCIRKLGTPAYRILCVRQIRSLRSIDGVYVSQDEYDRAFPSFPLDGQPTTMMMMPPPPNSGGVAFATMAPTAAAVAPVVQPLTTFRMEAPAPPTGSLAAAAAAGAAVSAAGGGLRSVAPRSSTQPPAPLNMNTALNMYGYGSNNGGGAAPQQGGGVNSSRATAGAASGSGTASGARKPPTSTTTATSTASSRPAGVYGSKAMRR